MLFLEQVDRGDPLTLGPYGSLISCLPFSVVFISFLFNVDTPIMDCL